MRRMVQCLLALGVVFATLVHNSPARANELAGGGWKSDYAAAMREASRLQKPLLIHFGATWCPPCKKMEAEVLHTAPVREMLQSDVVGYLADFDRDRQLAMRFNIEKVPSDVLLDPTTGKVILQSQGPQALQNYLAMSKDAGVRLNQRLAQKTGTSAPRADVTPGVTQPQLGEPKPLVGLDGYSPVALGASRDWQRGSADFSWIHKGVTYHLRDKEELEQFRVAPDDFAPQLLGCDPVVLSEADRAVVGSTRFGAYYDDELYLFVSADNRSKFKQNPVRYARQQHVLNVDRIEQTELR